MSEFDNSFKSYGVWFNSKIAKANETIHTIKSTICSGVNIFYFIRYNSHVPSSKNYTKHRQSINFFFHLKATLTISISTALFFVGQKFSLNMTFCYYFLLLHKLSLNYMMIQCKFSPAFEKNSAFHQFDFNSITVFDFDSLIWCVPPWNVHYRIATNNIHFDD